MTTSAAWLPLFKIAVKILSQGKVPKNQWSFGGGTALMTYYNHRKSKDVDIFLRDAQLLTRFTPRLNDFVADRVDDYSEMSNYLKLRIGRQEIDFIVAPFLTQEPVIRKKIGGMLTMIETPEEIAVKKMFYRAESLKSRDVIDLAAVIRDRAIGLLDNIAVYESRIPVLLDRLKILKRVYPVELAALDIIDRQLANTALETVSEFFHEVI